MLVLVLVWVGLNSKGNQSKGDSMGVTRVIWRSRLQLAAAATSFGIITAACGGTTSGVTPSSGSSAGDTIANMASAPGVTPTSILLGSHQSLTGLVAPGYSEIAPAAQAFFDYLNARGGVYGRHITLKYADDAYNPSQTTQVVQRLVSQNGVFAILGGLGTTTHQAVVNYLNTNKVPDIFVASGCDCWNNPTKFPYTYGFVPDYIIEGKIIGTFLQSDFGGKKIGVIYQNDDFGGEGLQGLHEIVPASQIVSEIPYDPSKLANGLATQVASLQSAGAQVVVLFTVPEATAQVLLAMQGLSYTPTTVSSSVGSDPYTLSGLISSISKGTVGASILQGLYSTNYLPLASSASNPWIALFKKIHAQYDGSDPFDENTVFGMSLAFYFSEAIKAAGQNPTRQSLVAAIESQGSSFIGPGITPLGYSKSQHLGFMGEEVVQLGLANSVLPVSPIYTTNVSGPVRTQASSQAAIPSSLG